MPRDFLKVTKGLSEKIYPVLPAFLKAYGEAIKGWRALSPNPPAELLAKIETRLKDELEQVAREYPRVPVPVLLATVLRDLLPEEQEIDEGKGLNDTLHFYRHLRPLATDIEAVNNGDKEARKRVYRTARDLLALQFGQGPLAKTKANLDHLNIFEFGLGLGLERLTADELAEFFDAVCWCGQEHDADGLKKQRQRIIKILTGALANQTQPGSAEPSLRRSKPATGHRFPKSKPAPAPDRAKRSK